METAERARLLSVLRGEAANESRPYDSLHMALIDVIVYIGAQMKEAREALTFTEVDVEDK